MTVVRLIGAVLVFAAAVSGLVGLLMREGTGVEHLALVGSVGGALVGVIWRGRKGLLVGSLLGAALGLITPCLYTPFWLVFTLPPHPEVEL